MICFLHHPAFPGERFSLQVPRTWAGQKVKLFAGSASFAHRLSEEMAGDPRPRSLAQVRQWLADRRDGGYLYVMVTRSGPGMRARVEAMPFLPPSVIATMSGHSAFQARGGGVAWEERRAQPGVLMGGARKTIKVLSH